MTRRLETESTLTDRYQTTVPEIVRKALGVGKREKIKYSIHGDGSVVMSKAVVDSEDHVVGAFLNLLAQDARDNPATLKALTPELVTRIDDLIGDTEIDLDEPLSDEE
ncbi:type II toxin-antitoxin system PrlF family antitoxin [Endozoicomonas gorgoniicola]|uniref:Type II toxin-antitoxin system PrlF family antitoxin n=1 Tax=Endozoicomonas gorgoniicola TaxID=1234144 RepID=A0ABT3MUX0_9GAMM|nr:type II toxin-antitoxin system PrlF family antitoxin [Endozoicomonas gorgoniicola]MCW7553181.1 type II toxin-antitoxin system PrlF family antitoxin [Endozoicomonas gorgoniicola]